MGEGEDNYQRGGGRVVLLAENMYLALELRFRSRSYWHLYSYSCLVSLLSVYYLLLRMSLSR